MEFKHFAGLFLPFWGLLQITPKTKIRVCAHARARVCLHHASDMVGDMLERYSVPHFPAAGALGSGSGQGQMSPSSSSRPPFSGETDFQICSNPRKRQLCTCFSCFWGRYVSHIVLARCATVVEVGTDFEELASSCHMDMCQMDTLGIEPRAFRMRSGCDTTTPCAL